eukprot:TRINITY_DN4427_c0_g1_i1.p1 TRINITY_DN4427_c0_g1~~TRINITY_DN4427_c0_g1_i1.p1  ORF type:complete len:388 (+),score=85.93 TRINITY_DN4427_c0_g1_i1:421-1584(+)
MSTIEPRQFRRGETFNALGTSETIGFTKTSCTIYNRQFISKFVEPDYAMLFVSVEVLFQDVVVLQLCTPPFWSLSRIPDRGTSSFDVLERAINRFGRYTLPFVHILSKRAKYEEARGRMIARKCGRKMLLAWLPWQEHEQDLFHKQADLSHFECLSDDEEIPLRLNTPEETHDAKAPRILMQSKQFPSYVDCRVPSASSPNSYIGSPVLHDRQVTKARRDLGQSALPHPPNRTFFISTPHIEPIRKSSASNQNLHLESRVMSHAEPFRRSTPYAREAVRSICHDDSYSSAECMSEDQPRRFSGSMQPPIIVLDSAESQIHPRLVGREMLPFLTLPPPIPSNTQVQHPFGQPSPQLDPHHVLANHSHPMLIDGDTYPYDGFSAKRARY